jgi:uncharacterized protein (DUF779 family)
MITRITTTEAADKLIDELKKTHGELMFHQSGGCCDGSAPMCFSKGEFYLALENFSQAINIKSVYAEDPIYKTLKIKLGDKKNIVKLLSGLKDKLNKGNK